MKKQPTLSTCLLLACLTTAAMAGDDFRKSKTSGAERVIVTARGGPVTVCDAAGQPRRVAAGASVTLAGDVAYLPAAGAGAADVDAVRSRYAALAARWAPVVYQDTDDTKTAADYITTVDYDGDWNTRNNWENFDRWRSPALGTLAAAAAGYWWVVETRTHWFIGYGYFHPRDWEDADGVKGWAKYHVFNPIQAMRGKGSGQHENDMEGALLMVRKERDGTGTLELVETQAHNHFWQYSPRGVLSALRDGKKARETLDGEIRLEQGHPAIYIEAKGHGIYGSPAKTKFDGRSGDGIVYRYRADGGAVRGEADYALIPMELLWRRYQAAPGHRDETWSLKGGRAAFAGDTYDHDSANPPWGWSDKEYPASVNETFFAEPARWVTWRFQSAAGKPISLDVVGRSCP